MRALDQLHAKAKRAIASGESFMRDAATYLAEARELGATQRHSAKAIGKSAAWVNQLLRWHDEGFKKSPFGPQSKAKRSRVQPPKQARPEASAKWEAQRARAEAVAAMFGAPISNHARARLVVALEALPSDHPAERVRARLGMSWNELIVAAAAESDLRLVA